MRTGPFFSLLLVIGLPCAMLSQARQGVLLRRSFAGPVAGLRSEAPELPETPSPVWSQKEFTVEAACESRTAPAPGANGEPCAVRAREYSRFLDSTAAQPMTSAQKGVLAVRNVVDSGNLATIAGSAGFTSLTNSRTAYGPGWTGFGRGVGVGLLGDATAQFFGTFAIPAWTHEDPHYHRMPHAAVGRRVLHAVSRTVIAQSDSGRPMPNYATLGGYPISAEIANLYVPGIHGNGPSTVARVLTGYATDPVDNLVTEFLPDVARHIHIHVVFAQQLLNQISSDGYPTVP